MPISPLYVGATHRSLSITWLRDDATPVDLTASSITMRFSSDTGVPAAFTGTGVVAITAPTLGQFTYTFAIADLATAGNYHVQFVADYGSSRKEFSDAIPFFILADL